MVALTIFPSLRTESIGFQQSLTYAEGRKFQQILWKYLLHFDQDSSFPVLAE